MEGPSPIGKYQSMLLIGYTQKVKLLQNQSGTKSKSIFTLIRKRVNRMSVLLIVFGCRQGEFQFEFYPNVVWRKIGGKHVRRRHSHGKLQKKITETYGQNEWGETKVNVYEI